jgi:hypothetical protein
MFIVDFASSYNKQDGFAYYVLVQDWLTITKTTPYLRLESAILFSLDY